MWKVTVSQEVVLADSIKALVTNEGVQLQLETRRFWFPASDIARLNQLILEAQHGVGCVMEDFSK